MVEKFTIVGFCCRIPISLFFLEIHMDYKDLLENQNYQEIITTITEEASEKTDKDLRLLSYSYYKIENYQDALESAQKIKDLEVHDLNLIMHIYWELENWDEMRKVAKRLLKEKPSGNTYYLLALAENNGKWSSEIDSATKEIIVNYLKRATKFDDAPSGAVIFLSRFMEGADKISILEKGLGNFSDDFDLRLELIDELLTQKDFDKALSFVETFLSSEYSEDAGVYLLEIAVEKKDYAQAEKLIDSLKIDEKDKRLIQADLLFKKRDLSKWLIFWQENFDETEEEILIVQSFQKAYLNFRNNDNPKGLDDFVKGAKKLLETKNFPVLDVHISANRLRHYYYYFSFDVIRDVCETILLINQESHLPKEVVGLAVYVLTSTASTQESLSNIEAFIPKHENKSLIELAAELLDYPPELGDELAWFYRESNPFKATKFLISGALHSQYVSTHILNDIKGAFVESNGKIKPSALRDVQEIIKTYLEQVNLSDKSQIIDALLPIYQHLVRALLIGGDDYKVVRELSLKFMQASKEEEGLFDFAYSSYHLGQISDAEEAYKKLIEQEPENDAAINNLAVIYENQGKLNDAFSLYKKAAEIQSEEKLYLSNLSRIKNRFDKRSASQSKIENEIGKRKVAAAELGISDDISETINRLYWESETTAKSIEASFGLTSKRLNSIVIPLRTNIICPNCVEVMFYKSRTERNSGHGICIGCGHKSSGWCRCEFCLQQEQIKRQKQQERLRISQFQEFQNLRDRYSTTEYIEWSIDKLSRKDKQFLNALINAAKNDELDWRSICERAGVVSEKTYIDKLRKLKLVFFDPDQKLYVNSAIEIELLQVENVRRISPSIRFEVFQRDNHTCQYCGRTPPDVKLVIDHLIPVAHGGTDDFNNLVTSCEECNSGKSAKLIEQFTGSSSKEEWTKKIRAKRLAIFETRRGRIEEIKQHWIETLNLRRLSESDENAIFNFIERYDPDWIKTAIEIAARKKVGYYVSYAGAILKSWAKDGPPENLSDPDGFLAKKLATAKQVAYIATLLEKAGMKLSDLSEKADFNQLTMLDARNIITALTEKIEVD